MRPDVKELVRLSIAGKTGDPPWMWCSFAGDTFLGVAIVRAWNVGHAASVCWSLGINPGGECMAIEVPDHFGPPPPEMDHKLVADKVELERLTQLWHGSELVRVNSNLEPQDQ